MKRIWESYAVRTRSIVAYNWNLHSNQNYLEPGRNIDPLMKTAPDKRMYQQDDNSPVLLKLKKLLELMGSSLIKNHLNLPEKNRICWVFFVSNNFTQGA